MVVVVIMGMIVGLVSVLVEPDDRSLLNVEAQRLAQLLDLAAAEARVSSDSRASVMKGSQACSALHLAQAYCWRRKKGAACIRT